MHSYIKTQKKINSRLSKNEHLIGVSVGSGLNAINSEDSKADFILALSSGIYRQRGVGSFGAYLPSSNSNHLVQNLCEREILPRIDSIPLIFGLMATDPTIDLDTYLLKLKKLGIVGINNYPTVSLIDGDFREKLEKSDMGFKQEVKAIQKANELGFYTIAFISTTKEAEQMIEVGADIICLHLGLTVGGRVGAKRLLSLQATNRHVEDVLKPISDKYPQQILMIYGGAINNSLDVHFIYNNNSYVSGYIGGSVFERLPTEKLTSEIIDSYRTTSRENYLDHLSKKNKKPQDYISFIQKYIENNYAESILLEDLAKIMHLSRPYLSQLFKDRIGLSFQEYLINFRLTKAKQLIENSNLSLVQIAKEIGYTDYPHFSKSFKQKFLITPNDYVKAQSLTKTQTKHT